MSQTAICKGTATSVFEENGYTRVLYHNTIVAKWNADEIILNTGGWKTMTTKTRMNQASNQFDLGFVVTQKDGRWFIRFGGKEAELLGEVITINRLTCEMLHGVSK